MYEVLRTAGDEWPVCTSGRTTLEATCAQVDSDAKPTVAAGHNEDFMTEAEPTDNSSGDTSDLHGDPNATVDLDDAHRRFAVQRRI